VRGAGGICRKCTGGAASVNKKKGERELARRKAATKTAQIEI
jgi:hypothetical protein